MQTTPSNRPAKIIVPLLIVMSLMFFWNMSRNINDVLIPHLKRACQLTDLQSSLVQSAFFGAYFLLALPAGMYIQRKGYKAGMVTGLLIASLGAAMFYPAAEMRYYPLFLASLFIMAAGFTFLEVTATPYISKLGSADEVFRRLGLFEAVGVVGANFGPFIGSLFLLHKKDISPAEIESYSPSQLQSFLTSEASLVKLPYISLSLLFLFIAVILFFIQLPPIKDEESTQYSFTNIFHFPHTILGVISVFCYLGAEVGIVSFLICYSKSQHLPGLTEQGAALFIALFMALVLSGRLGGAYVLKKISPPKMLLASAGGAFVLVALAILTRGYLSISLLAFVGLFTSIMYPIIFTLSIKGLGNYTKTASSLLIMGIVGGAIVPPLMGFVSDKMDIKWSFIFPMLCYMYILFYALSGYKMKSALKENNPALSL